MINIPHNRAIELLEARLQELKLPGIDINAFKSRLQIDVERIFGGTSTQSIAVLTFSILHFGEPDKTAKIKTNIQQTIQGWINYIKDIQIIDQEKVQVSEKEFKIKYINLLKKWNDLIPEYNEIMKSQEALTLKYDESLAEIAILKSKLIEKEQIPDQIIKILFLGASPAKEVRLRIDEELRDIENGLRMATLRDSFDIKSKWAVTPKSLQQAMLEENPSIVHFSGHGDIHGIAVEDSIGNTKLINTAAIGSLFELFSGNIKCVVLNSCYSESQALEISKYVPYVIGMKSSVYDKAAIAFSVGFYSALGVGKDIVFAFKMGIVAVKMEGISGSDVPVLVSIKHPHAEVKSLFTSSSQDLI